MDRLKKILVFSLTFILMTGSISVFAATPKSDTVTEKKTGEADNAKDEDVTAAVTSIREAGISLTKSVYDFSEYVKESKKKIFKPKTTGVVEISVSTSIGDTESKRYSDVLTYRYNSKMTKKISDKEYEILCRIVEAEAGDQDVYGRILVANVILNRVNYKKEFENDIEGVVFEKNQFAPVADGSYYKVGISSLTKEAVDRCLDGEDYSDGALFFFMRSGTTKNTAAWFDSLKFICKYGCHEFFKY